ncbi:dihydropteroate synthase [Deferrisoma palaeochoriense]
MLLIGEKINGTRPAVREAVLTRNEATVRRLARAQWDAGADALDLNAGTEPDREPDDLAWLVENVRREGEGLLCLDSANPKALEAGLAAAGGTALINSISGEESRLDTVLPLAAARNCPVIALALDDRGIPQGVEGRLAAVRRVLRRTRAAGLAPDRVYVDPLVLTVATDHRSAAVALETMRRVREEFPEVHLTVGLSNVSYGLPLRSLVNRAFLTLALAAGLDSAILDPTDRGLMGALYAARLVLGHDRNCLDYTRAFRAGRLWDGR